jgi:hypothetical protein
MKSINSRVFSPLLFSMLGLMVAPVMAQQEEKMIRAAGPIFCLGSDSGSVRHVAFAGSGKVLGHLTIKRLNCGTLEREYGVDAQGISLVRLQYGYDRDNNRLYANNLVNSPLQRALPRLRRQQRL